MIAGLEVFQEEAETAIDLDGGRARRAALDDAMVRQFAASHRTAFRFRSEGWLRRDNKAAWVSDGALEEATAALATLVNDVTLVIDEWRMDGLTGRSHRRTMARAANVVSNWRTQAARPKYLQMLLARAGERFDVGPLFFSAPFTRAIAPVDGGRQCR